MTAAPTLLVDYYLRRADQTPESVAFYSHDGAAWTPTSWGQFVTEARVLAAGLADIGLKSSDRLGIMAPTGQAWESFQLAGLLLGAAIVGLDAHDQPDRLLSIANASELAGLVIGHPELLARLNPAQIPTLRFVAVITKSAPLPELKLPWATMEQLLAKNPPRKQIEPPSPATLATLIFTSGSTGAPKGIGYTHAQVCLAVESILEAFPEITPQDRLVCWLPLSNLFQRMLNFCAAGRGAQTYFVADPRTIISHLPTIKPNVFIAVPRFFEKLNEGIDQRLAQQSALARGVVGIALQIGDAVARRKRDGLRVSGLLNVAYQLADNLVLSKLRAVMGGEVRFMVSGSAAFPRWLLERFHAMGLLVLEAYGLSENVVPVAINRVSAYRFGSVGRVLRANDIKIGSEGEVLVKGGGVFGGYLTGESNASIDPEGYLATGDQGVIDGDRYLHLVGRISEIFKTSTGRKIAPIGIESKLKRIEGVDQAVVVGAGKKAVAALITLTPETILSFADASSFQQFARRVADQIPVVLSDESGYMRPVGLAISKRAFTIESGELTSNLKLRRKVIEENYREELNSLFARVESADSGFNEMVNRDVCILDC